MNNICKGFLLAFLLILPLTSHASCLKVLNVTWEHKSDTPNYAHYSWVTQVQNECDRKAKGAVFTYAINASRHELGFSVDNEEVEPWGYGEFRGVLLIEHKQTREISEFISRIK